MRQKPQTVRRSNKDRPPHRRHNADIPTVPTFKPDREAATATKDTPDDEAAEAVRRMVEAAYT